MTRYSHTGKSEAEKKYYKKAIQNIDNKPTINDALDFSESDDTQEDFSVSKTQKMQRVKWPQKFIDHFKTKWISWIFAAASFVIVFLVFEFSRNLGRTEVRLDIVVESINKIESRLLESSNKSGEQGLKIMENRIRLDYLEKSIDRLK